MPRLHIVVGRATRTAPPEVLYCGEDVPAALKALATSPLLFAEYFRNPRGIRKQVTNAAANAAAIEAAFTAEVDAEQANYNSAVLGKAEELAAAKAREAAEALAAADKAHREQLAQLERGHAAALAERDATVESLRAALKAAKKKAGEAPPPEPQAP